MNLRHRILKAISRLIPFVDIPAGRNLTTVPVGNNQPQEPTVHVPCYHLRSDQGRFVLSELIRAKDGSVRYRVLCLKTEQVFTVDRKLFDAIFCKETQHG